jgi:kynurenine formamidase
MRIRSFIIAYALVLAILLFADRRPGSSPQDRYSHVIDLTEGQNPTSLATDPESRTRIISPGALIPGTWAAGQIPAERLVAPLVVMDLKAMPEVSQQISLDDIAAWELQHGMIPQGAVVAVRAARPQNYPAHDFSAKDASPANPERHDWSRHDLPVTPLPIARDAAEFLIEARNTIGFAVETSVDLTSDRTLARQLALRGNYVVEGAARFTALPATGSLIIVAPARDKKSGEVPVRILAMVH